MKKSWITFGAALLIAGQGFAASYWVVLRDGTRYEAKSKPAIANGRATVNLATGQVLQLDGNQIDFAKSDEMTRNGGLQVMDLGQPAPAPTRQASSLGSAIRLRKPQAPAAAPAAGAKTDPAPATPVAPQPTSGPKLGTDVLDKFERAYENVGIFEHKLSSTGPRTIRVEIVTDNEEKVFNALSATAFLIVRNAGLSGVLVEQVDLFMKQTTGGAAGRFQMTREDAQALDSKTVTREEYFVKKVLY